MTTTRGVVMGAFVLMCSVAMAQKFVLGVRAGTTMPMSAETRRAFGDQWFSFSITPFPSESKKGLRQGADFNITTRNQSGNRLALWRPSYGFSRAFGDDQANLVPYIAARVGPVYADYAINTPGGRVSEKKFGWGANFEFGFVFSQKFIISARYDLMSKFNNFDFNGITLQATLKIGSF